MGSSAKKKAEKKKDFKKEKLKVGKQKPKPSNLTDTSFRSKGIVLREQQSLSISAPAAGDQFIHHLSLLSSRSENQRRDSLSFLATFIASRAADESLPQPSAALLAKLLPVSLDGSDGVRNQLLRALKAFRLEEIQDQGDKILLYVRTGMTHLAAGIRDTSMDILAWALQVIPEQLVTSPGGWIKTLRYFALMLGWSSGSASNASKATQLGGGARSSVKTLNTLAQYLRAGLDEVETNAEVDYNNLCFPLVDIAQHRLSTISSPFAYLNLFSSHQTEDDNVYQERAERQAIFSEELRDAFVTQLATSKKGGGELGRVAGQIEAVIEEGMTGFEQS